MKLVSFQTDVDSPPELGIVLGNMVFSFVSLADWVVIRLTGKQFQSLTEFKTLDNALEKWENFYPKSMDLLHYLADYHPEDLAVQESIRSYPTDEILYHPPIHSATGVFRDFYAFEQHVKTARANRGLEIIPEWYEFPVFYFSNARSMKGHRIPIEKPAYTEQMDYELEIGCVIGKRGKNITGHSAKDYIAGYTILNDWSARDIQRKEMKVGLGPAKGKDFATSAGPYLVTPDELETYRSGKGFNIVMKAFRNDQLLSQGNWNSIHYSFEEMIERASAGVELYPGDLLGSGTVGTGCILEIGAEKAGGWIQSGDTVRLQVDVLGELENSVMEDLGE
ncbi:MAG: fumarylacetoacetate hydrolase family protein [Calditrichia bacterium]